VESGVDFEKRIAIIYQQCRTLEQIQFEFDQLQHELETEIASGQQDAREKLLNNFDQEVVEKVRIQSNDFLDRFNQRLWLLTRHLLEPYARFEETGYSFMLHSNPFPGETIHPGPYRMGKLVDDANTYRVGHPLAQRVLQQGKGLPVATGEVTFRYRESGKNIAILEALVGHQGWITCTHVVISALEPEDHLIFAGINDNGEALDESQCRRLFDLPGEASQQVDLPDRIRNLLDEDCVRKQQYLVDAITSRNGHWFDTEMEKLDRWAEDRRATLKAELVELDEALKECKKAARLAPNLPEKLEQQREVRKLETKRDESWRAYDQASRDLDRQKDSLLDKIAQRLEQDTEESPLFTVRWRVA
jgi:hypothetical protein